MTCRYALPMGSRRRVKQTYVVTDPHSGEHRAAGWLIENRKTKGYSLWGCQHEIVYLIARAVIDSARAQRLIETWVAATAEGKTLSSLASWRSRRAPIGLVPSATTPANARSPSDDPPY